MAPKLKSAAFEEGEMMPSKYTCDGEDVSPALSWVGAPDETQSLALVVEDIDSVKGVWSHWVVYDLPPDVDRLTEGVSSAETCPEGGIQGRNDFGNVGYGGPCPSDGKSHRYVVRLYAVDKRLGLPPGATREGFSGALMGMSSKNPI